METTLDTQELETKVKDMYRHVAEQPQGKYHFELGRPLAEHLGYPADILDDNNLMLSTVFRTATSLATKAVYVSSSMVFERAGEWPTPEDAIDRYPPPFSAYGFSKLVGELLAARMNREKAYDAAMKRHLGRPPVRLREDGLAGGYQEGERDRNASQSGPMIL